MSFGEGNLRTAVAELEGRIAELEELVRDMHSELNHVRDDVFLMDYIEKRMAELGVMPDDE